MAKIYHADLYGNRESKYNWLEKNDINTATWNELNPQSEFYLFIPQDVTRKAIYDTFEKITEIFPINNVGIVTARDALTIAWSKDELWRRIINFTKLDEETARLTFELGTDSRDWKVKFAQKDLVDSKLDKDRIVNILYRPFDLRYTYYTGNSRGFHCTPRNNVMQHLLKSNLSLISVRQVAEKKFNHTFISSSIVECRITLSNKGYGYIFPLYIYPETDKKDLFSDHESEEKKPNINEELIKQLNHNFTFPNPPTNPRAKRAVRSDKVVKTSPEEIFYYIYAVLYSNTYRTKYAEFLKIDFPRVPFTKNYKLYLELGNLGKQLADLHLLKDEAFVTTISKFEGSGNNEVEKPKYENEKVWINKERYFDGIKEEVWNYQIGGYQVCEKWLKDRKNRPLTLEEIQTYCKIVTALSKTIEIQNQIDELYPEVEKTL